MQLATVSYNGKNYQVEIDQLNIEVISNLFGFPDSNFAIIDANNVVIRRQANSFLVTEDRAPFQVVRTAPTSTRT